MSTLNHQVHRDFLLVSLLVILPHAWHWPVGISLVCLTLLGLKFYSNRVKRYVWSRWLLSFAALSAFGFVYAYHGQLLGRDAGVSLLSLMLCLKLLESRRYRDGVVIIMMLYFLVITHFLYSQSILLVAYLSAVVIAVTASMLTLNEQQFHQHWKTKLKTAFSLFAGALPVMLILFVLFPRIPGPLWGLPSDAASGRTGLSDSMTPGNISNLVESNEVAFRARFINKTPPNHELYWRGVVMDYFDGQTWRTEDAVRQSTRRDNPDQIFSANVEKLAPSASPIRYEITLEPHGKRWLFGLEIADWQSFSSDQADLRVAEQTGFQLRSLQPVNNLIRYEMESALNSFYGNNLQPQEQISYLQLPDNSHPRLVAYAKRLRRTHRSQQAIISTVLNEYAQRFTYTLRPPLLGRHAMDEFFFDTARGFCEHFSSSFVIIMRAAGIPARIVTGYQGAELNPLSDYWIIRQSDAHAWTEVWSDEGWQRIDPTAFIAPSRIEQGVDAALEPAENPRFTLARDNSLLRTLNLSWDLVNNRWNSWILGYGPEQQQSFLSRFGIDSKNLQQLILVLSLTLGLVLGLLAYLYLRRQPAQPVDPLLSLFQKLTNAVDRKTQPEGYLYEASTSPNQYLQDIRRIDASTADLIRPLINQYTHWRYARPETLTAQSLRLFDRKLQRVIKQLKQ